MELVADEAYVKGSPDPLLPTTSFVALPGEVAYVSSDPGPSMVALALALGGRLRLTSGRISLWDNDRRGYLQEHVALVDVDGITSPEPNLSTLEVMSEQLALAGLRSGLRVTRELLAGHGLADRDRDLWESLGADERTDLLLDVATRRHGVQAVVLAGPDRHGGAHSRWLRRAHELAISPMTVVVLAQPMTLQAYGVPDSRISQPATDGELR